jgi:hypothetical protein
MTRRVLITDEVSGSARIERSLRGEPPRRPVDPEVVRQRG